MTFTKQIGALRTTLLAALGELTLLEEMIRNHGTPKPNTVPISDPWFIAQWAYGTWCNWEDRHEYGNMSDDYECRKVLTYDAEYLPLDTIPWPTENIPWTYGQDVAHEHDMRKLRKKQLHADCADELLSDPDEHNPE